MMKRLITIVFTLFFSFVGFSQTADAFKLMKAENLPVQVQQGFDKMNLDFDPKWAYDNNLYEARAMVDGHKVYYRFSDNGNFLEKRTLKNWETDASEILKESKKKTYYKNWEVIEFYECENSSNEFYVVQLKNKEGNLKTMYFNESGELESKSNSGY